jgi:hypothetical protein
MREECRREEKNLTTEKRKRKEKNVTNNEYAREDKSKGDDAKIKSR